MELHVGLPSSTHEDPFKGFLDQMKTKGVKPHIMEKTNCSGFYMGSDNGCLNNKRSYEEAFVKIKKASSFSSCNSLPLLLWAGQPNEEDDDREREKKKVSAAVNRTNMKEEEDHHVVVGWPPIKSWRRKLLHPNHGGYIIANNRGGGHLYVCKGKCEGVSDLSQTKMEACKF